MKIDGQGFVDNVVKIYGAGSDLVRAWLICSLALRLDDDIAREILSIGMKDSKNLNSLTFNVKEMPGIWKEMVTYWYVAEDLRRAMLRRVPMIIAPATITEMRLRIARHCDRRAEECEREQTSGLFDAFSARLARHEAAYQRVLIPDEAIRGTRDWLALAETGEPATRRATVESIAYLLPEIMESRGSVPRALNQLIERTARDTA